MTTLVEHARRELALLGEDPPFAASLIAALEGFTTYGHSGGSAASGIDLLERLLRREALTPITSDPAEWVDRSEESGSPMWQNARESRAVSTDGGKTWWYVDARHPGERCHDGDELGVLVRCRMCGGSGVLHRPDKLPPAPEPQR